MSENRGITRHWPLVLPAVVALLAYGGSLHGQYVHDDHAAIAGNAALQAGDWLGAAFGPEHTPLSGRPFACASFVVADALGLDGPFGQRVVNLIVHSLNAVLVTLLVRGTLSSPSVDARRDARHTTRIAASLAMLFAAHPLTVDAVAYPTQRSMLLMATALLTALLATLRAASSARPWCWRALAIAALAFGMGCKEEFVAAPLLVVLYQRAYLVPTWAALRPQRAFHLGLAATWLLLLVCVVAAPANRTVGYDAIVPVSAFEWLLTQAPVVVHYAAASVWPAQLVPVYDWPIVRSPADILLPGALVVGGVGVTLWLWRRRPWWGWLGALFFLLLAPTSSVLPIVTEAVADRRAYLPMLAVLAPAALGLDHALGRWCRSTRARDASWLVVMVAALVLAGTTTRRYAEVYADDTRLWSYSYEHNELTSRSFAAGTILANQAVLLRLTGRTEQAHDLLDRAAESGTLLSAAEFTLAASLLERGREVEALLRLRRLLGARPDHADATVLLCKALLDVYARPDAAPRSDRTQRFAEAEQRLTALLEHRPEHAPANNLLGMLLAQTGRVDAAETAFRRAMQTDPSEPSYADNLLLMLRRERGPAAALRFWRPIAATRPDDAAAQKRLAQLCLETDDRDGALTALQAVLRLLPNDAETQTLLARLRQAR